MYILVAISRLGAKHVLVTISTIEQPVPWPVLGKGGQATVYKIAKDTQSYAVKEMTLCGYNDIDSATFSELASLCFLMNRDDPPLAPPVEHIMVDLDHNLVFCVMQQFDFSLSDVIHSRIQRPVDIKSVAQSLTYILTMVHGYGIVHLDIKPSNILVLGDTMVLSDWGLSLACERPIQVGTSNLVTITHRPPELLWNSHVVGPFTDIWSLGVTIYELVELKHLQATFTSVGMMFYWMSRLGTPDEAYFDRLKHISGSIDVFRPLPNWPARPISAVVEHKLDDLSETHPVAAS
jgi:serine/threonine protein kinase